MSYSSGKIDQARFEDLRESERVVGQIYPVVKNADGVIIDGAHKKRVNLNWKEVVLHVRDKLKTLRLRIRARLLRMAL